jgi:hypothetical protein
MQRRPTRPMSLPATARAEQQKADPPPYVPGMEVAGTSMKLEAAPLLRS